MSCEKKIIIVVQQMIVGSLGTEMYFVPYRQYCFEDTSMRDVECYHCSNKNKLVRHFRVVIDTEDFYIPETIAAMSVYDINLVGNSFKARMEAQTEQPADYKAVYKDLTGIDLKAGDVVTHNGYDLWKKVNSKNDEEVGSNGKV